MKEILEALRSRGLKFLLAYLVGTVIYLVFDYVYLPWLTYKFGSCVFVPLYPSILLANTIGVYLYDFLGEDIMFMEFGKSWVSQDGGRMNLIKKCLRKSSKAIFIALSIWPSPIASYIFFRKKSGESLKTILLSIAEGSVYCTIVWGGLLSLVRLLIIQIVSLI
jgi:hypothetical protein